MVWESFDMKKQGLRRVGRTPCVLVEGLGIFHVALSEDVLGHSRQSSRSTLPQSGLLKTGVSGPARPPGHRFLFTNAGFLVGLLWSHPPHSRVAVSLLFHEYQLFSYCCFNVPASH